MKEKQDVYENLIKKMNIPSPEIFNQLTYKQQKDIINNFIIEIRKINLFPIYYYNKQGINKEIQQCLQKNNIVFNKDDNLDIYFRQGSMLLDFLFPNLHRVIAGFGQNKTIYDIFMDDEKLFQCLYNFIKRRKIYTLRTAFFSQARYKWNAAINFSPMRAKAIYERFCPANGIIYDYSAGFGGRMLGALSSNNNYTYIAIQPNSDTYYNLLQLGQLIENNTHRKNSFQIYNNCSEIFLPKEKIDFAFSCPPFFDLERYSNEQTQSIIKFPEYNVWLEEYVRPTIKNCYVSLKENGIYGVDLMNYYKHNKKICLIEDWIKIAQEEKFYLQTVSLIKSHSRKKNDADQEQLFIFTKNKNNKNYMISKKYKKLIQENEKKKILQKKFYCYYNLKGELLQTYESLKEMQEQLPYSKKELQQAIKTKQIYNKHYFRVFTGENNILKSIKVKKIVCEINNQYFYSYAEIGRYTSVSRQAAQQAKQRSSKKINGYQIIWY